MKILIFYNEDKTAFNNEKGQYDGINGINWSWLWKVIWSAADVKYILQEKSLFLYLYHLRIKMASYQVTPSNKNLQYQVMSCNIIHETICQWSETINTVNSILMVSMCKLTIYAQRYKITNLVCSKVYNMIS